MKTLLWIILVAGLVYGGMSFFEYYQAFDARQKKDGAPARTTADPVPAPTPVPSPARPVAPAQGHAAKPAGTAVSPAGVLPGMPASLEPILAASYKRGAVGLRDFIARYGQSIQDPRLASIELDYTVLVAGSDVTEARKVFDRVRFRTVLGSPVYDRVKQLEHTYGEK